MFLDKAPRQFYFLVPEKIVLKVAPITPEWAGLAFLRDERFFDVLKTAPLNQKSQRLTVRECVKIFHLISNQLVAQANAIDRHFSNWRESRHIGDLEWSPEI